MVFDNAVQPIQIKPEKSSKEDEFHDSIGPSVARECRDVVFLVIFVIFMTGMGLVTWRAVTIGNPYRIIYGTDSFGNVCNQDNKIIDGVKPSLTGVDLRNKPYLYYFNDQVFTSVSDAVGGKVESTKICVSQCPSLTLSTVSDMQNFTNVKGSRLCLYDVKSSSYFDGADVNSDCPPLPIKPHEEFLYRCIPTSLTRRIDHVVSAINSLLNAIEENLVEKGANDIANVWLEMCLLCLFAVVVSVILVLLLQFVAWFIVWFMVIAMVTGTLVATCVCWYHYNDLRRSLSATPADDRSVQMEHKVRDWLIGSLCVTGATVVILLIVIAVRKHIKLVVELFRQAGEAITCMPSLLLHPLLTVIFLGGTVCSLAWVLMYIETAGKVGYCIETSILYIAAIHGYGFCKAARQAFGVILNNALRVAAINSVGDFVLFIGKVATVAIVTVVGIEVVSVRKNINFVWLPVTVTGIFAYLIAGCFMSVYEMTIDTIFICYCEDSTINDGENRPYFMSVGLQRCMSARLKLEKRKSGKSPTVTDDTKS